MKDKLVELVEEFRSKIDGKNDAAKQYIPILRDNFIPFLIKNYPCHDLKSLFTEEITKNGLIDSAVFFIENNENIRRKSRLNFFLSALYAFFSELVFEKYPNPTIQKYHSFTILIDDICEKLAEKGIILSESESYPSINDEQFKFIVSYLNDNPAKTIKNKKEHIIIKLYLLYGISPDKLAQLKPNSYFQDRKILKIPCSTRKDLHINLELPYALSIEISDYISEISDKSSELLFSKATNSKIDSAFLKTILDKIKNSYTEAFKYSDVNNAFTQTGLQKYAIIKMIEAGMNQSIVMDFTGQSQDIFNDCQVKVDEDKQLNRNRYINYMIRSIDTYDEI